MVIVDSQGRLHPETPMPPDPEDEKVIRRNLRILWVIVGLLFAGSVYIGRQDLLEFVQWWQTFLGFVS